MRRKYFGLAMAAVATLGPAQAFGGDREIAQSIIERLKVSRDAGELKDFSLDMKVDEGVVLFRGKVNGDHQRSIVLATSEGVEGVRDVVDQLEVTPPELATTRPAKIFKPKSSAVVASDTAEASGEAFDEGFDFAGALALPTQESGQRIADASTGVSVNDSVAPTGQAPVVKLAQEVVPGIVRPAAAYEGESVSLPTPAPLSDHSPELSAAKTNTARSQADDEQLEQSVARAIGRAQQEGYLKNFGVDVHVSNGVIELEGNAASQQQREFLETIASHAPGANGVRNLIKINSASNSIAARPAAHRGGAPTMAPPMPSPNQGLQPLPAGNRMSATAMQPMGQTAPMHPMQRGGVPARMANYPQSYGGQQMINGEMVVPGSMVNHGAGYGGPMNGQMAGGGAPMMGQPVPMAPAAGVGAPRYDTPNLPNYAWPGYAANGNYAALSYPQQYSPSAFPFIGPFYPYPQVPLGWRKVSLEWDDGWWFLDFTDK